MAVDPYYSDDHVTIYHEHRDAAEPLMLELGANLTRIRKQHDLSLRLLAERSGVRVDVLQRAETGRWLLTVEQLDAVLAIYDEQ